MDDPARRPEVPPDLQRWGEALGRPGWPVIAGAVAAIVAIVAGLILALPSAAPGRRCGGRACRSAAGRLAALTPGGPAGPSSPVPAASSPARRSDPVTASPAPATSAPATSPPAAPSSSPPSSTPPATSAGPAVSVSYTVVRTWDGGFQGEFTIVNDGAEPVDGWQLSAVLPGDQVQSAWDASFQATGDTVTLTPPSYQAIIEPGASLAEHFTAAGADLYPDGCTLDGAPCV